MSDRLPIYEIERDIISRLKNDRRPLHTSNLPSPFRLQSTTVKEISPERK
jgi:hypothetical protein